MAVITSTTGQEVRERSRLLIALGGHVSPAIRAVRTDVLRPSFNLRNDGIAGTSAERTQLRALCGAIHNRIEADIALLDTLGGNADLDMGICA